MQEASHTREIAGDSLDNGIQTDDSSQIGAFLSGLNPGGAARALAELIIGETSQDQGSEKAEVDVLSHGPFGHRQGIDHCRNAEHQKEVGNIASQDISNIDICIAPQGGHQIDKKLRGGRAKGDHRKSDDLIQ